MPVRGNEERKGVVSLTTPRDVKSWAGMGEVTSIKGSSSHTPCQVTDASEITVFGATDPTLSTGTASRKSAQSI